MARWRAACRSAAICRVAPARVYGERSRLRLGTPIASRMSMMAAAIRRSSSVAPRLLPWRREAIAHEATAVPPGRPGNTGGAPSCCGRRVSGPRRCGADACRMCCRTPQRAAPSGAARRAGDGLRAVDERGELNRGGERHAAARLVGESEGLRAVVHDRAPADGEVEVVRPQRAVERRVAGL